MDFYSSCQLLESLRSASKVKYQRPGTKHLDNAILRPDNAATGAADLFLLECSAIAKRLNLDPILYANLQRETDSNCAWLKWFILASGVSSGNIHVAKVLTDISQSTERWTMKQQDVVIALNKKLSSILSYILIDHV